MPEKNHSLEKKRTLTSELEEMDGALIRLLGKRSRLLGKAAGSRKQKKKSLVDPGQEKQLWQNWRAQAESQGLDERMMHSLFHLVNGLGYERLEKKKDWEFELRPSKEPARMDLEGPGDILLSRMWVFMGAAAGVPLQLSGAVLNDPLFELIKGLNQAGGTFFWEKDLVSCRGGQGPDFDRKTLFVGQDPFNLYLLIFLAAMKPGVCRFSGGSRLKLIDLRPVERIVRALGGRMISLVPGSRGLPVRLESSGRIDASLDLPPDASPDMVQALVLTLAARLEPKAEAFVKQEDAGGLFLDLPRVFRVLTAAGGRFRQQEQGWVITGGRLDMPECPGLPLDPVFCGYLLAMAYVSRGRAGIQGEFPLDLPESATVLELFEKLGMEVTVDSAGVRGKFLREKTQPLSIDTRGKAWLLPLALAQVLCRQKEAELMVLPGEDLDFALVLLDSLGAAYSLSDDRLSIQGGLNLQDCPEVKMQTLHPWWSMALAVMALKRPGLIVKNPGELTRLWPQFWSLFKGLPDPGRVREAADPKTAGQRRKMRKKVS
ncbi:MAG: chorismate mutase [Desulfohalobiaceae bacterium]|nr:chorismate mutase [Desulfohalobiaceae bacterium]